MNVAAHYPLIESRVSRLPASLPPLTLMEAHFTHKGFFNILFLVSLFIFEVFWFPVDIFDSER